MGGLWQVLVGAAVLGATASGKLADGVAGVMVWLGSTMARLGSVDADVFPTRVPNGPFLQAHMNHAGETIAPQKKMSAFYDAKYKVLVDMQEHQLQYRSTMHQVGLSL